MDNIPAGGRGTPADALACSVFAAHDKLTREGRHWARKIVRHSSAHRA